MAKIGEGLLILIMYKLFSASKDPRSTRILRIHSTACDSQRWSNIHTHFAQNCTLKDRPVGLAPNCDLKIYSLFI